MPLILWLRNSKMFAYEDCLGTEEKRATYSEMVAGLFRLTPETGLPHNENTADTFGSAHRVQIA
jgi:hypothetical protein